MNKTTILRVNVGEDMKEKLKNLLSVKSIVTIALTVVFAYLAITKEISAEQFITIFTVIIGFYFGTQYQKNKIVKQEQEIEIEEESEE